MKKAFALMLVLLLVLCMIPAAAADISSELSQAAANDPVAQQALSDFEATDMSEATEFIPGTIDLSSIGFTAQASEASLGIIEPYMEETAPLINEDVITVDGSSKGALVDAIRTAPARTRASNKAGMQSVDKEAHDSAIQGNMVASQASGIVQGTLNSEIIEYMGNDGFIEVNFTVPAGGKVDLRMYNESLDTPYDLYLCTGDYSLLANAYDVFGGSTNATIIQGYLDAGNYIVLIDAYTGYYDPSAPIHLWLYHNSNLDQFEIDDQNISAAAVITDRVVLNRTLDVFSDIDWVKFTVNRNSSFSLVYLADVASPNYERMIFYKEENGTLVSMYGIRPGGITALTDIAPGTYYMRFEGEHPLAAGTSYSIELRLLAGSASERMAVLSNNQWDVNIYKIGSMYYVNNASMGTTLGWERSEGGPQTWVTSRLLSLVEAEKGLGNYSGLGTLQPAILASGTYTCTKYGTINNACIVQLGYGTSPLGHSPFYSYRAWTTSSTGQNTTVEGWSGRLAQTGAHFIVINLSQGNIVDFISGLNPFYDGRGDVEESWSIY